MLVFFFLTILLSVPFASGYLILSAYSGAARLDLAVKIALAPVFFLSFFILVYFVNVVSQRSLLANPLLLFSFFGIFLLIHGLLAWKAWAREQVQVRFVRQPLSWIRIAQALLLVLLIGSMVVLCLEANHYQLLLSGDIKRHLLFTRQILNGFPYSHYPPYDWAFHISYPSLTHMVIAFFKQLGQIQITTAYLLVYTLQLILLSLGMFLLIRKLTGKYWIRGLVLPLRWSGGRSAGSRQAGGTIRP